MRLNKSIIDTRLTINKHRLDVHILYYITANVTEASTAAIAAVGTANAEMLSATTDTEARAIGDDMPKELKDLRRRLNYLKNIYDIKDSVGSF